jgi:uncharacterized protein (DUF58 family)
LNQGAAPTLSRLHIAGVAPSARALWLLVVLAVVSLVIAARAPGAWTVGPAAAAALMLVTLADAVMAGGMAGFRVITPDRGEVGEPVAIRIEADLARAGGWTRPVVALATDPRLSPGGRIDVVLARDPAGYWSGTGMPSPSRRGTAAVLRGWLRWQGPLGLAHRQVTRDIAADVRVWPNLAPARGKALQMFLRDAGLGLVARRIRGDGSEFEALTEYQPGMDRRRIEWKSSARHAHLVAREYEIERNNQIVLAFDCGQAMCEPIGGLARIDRAVTAALTTAWVALKAEDRVSLFGFAARPLVMSPFVTSPSQFHRLQDAAAELDYRSEDANFTLAMATLATRLQRRSLVVLFADFTDPTAAETMIEMCSQLVRRHRMLFVVMRDDDLHDLAGGTVTTPGDVARAVVAQELIRQRAVVLTRLRQAGVLVIETPYGAIGLRLLETYLAIKREGSIG